MTDTQIRQTVRKAPKPRTAGWVILAMWVVGLVVIVTGLVIATRV